MKEKTVRNLQIYRLALYSISQSAIARHFQIKRQAVNEIYLRYAESYGPAEDLSVRLAPMPMIDQESANMLRAEAQRLRLPLAAIIRIAINQAAETGLTTENFKEEVTLVYQIPKTKITTTQNNVIQELSKDRNKSDVIRQIIKQYKPFNFNDKV